jgi:hypothetical protein
VQGCLACASQAAAAPEASLFSEPPPEFPGDQVAADHFQFKTETYLACIDVFSGFPFLFRCRTASTDSLLSAAQQVFLQTGLPRVLASDKGSAFMAQALQDFLRTSHVRHRVSTPQYAQSNGAAKQAVRTLKTLRAKCAMPFDLFQAVLEMQNTPRAPSNLSPADLFMGRRQRTLSAHTPMQNQVAGATHYRALELQQQIVTNRQPRPRHKSNLLWPGSQSLLRDFFGQTVTVTVLGYGEAPQAYKVSLPSGTVTERNLFFCSLYPGIRHRHRQTGGRRGTRGCPTRREDCADNPAVTQSPLSSSTVS